MDRSIPTVCFVLHAHLPYVKSDAPSETLEERWYFEAMADVYLPLLDMYGRLALDGVPFKLAMSVTPPLLAMLQDEELDARAHRFLERRAELAQLETERLKGSGPMAATARMYAIRYGRMLQLFDELGGGSGWLTRMGRLAEEGSLELLASAATHAFLPLVRTPEARRAQLAAGVAEYVRVFGRAPAGYWLPECGYMPELDAPLAQEGIAYTIVQFPHGPQRGAVRTPGGLTLLARDAAASAVVWDAASGYPGHADYRDYYEDIGFTLGQSNTPEALEETAYIRPYLLPDGTRTATGMKYARVTDRRGGCPKLPYEREKAMAAVKRHAADWLRRLARANETKGPIVAAFDAELFGHWWFEGPEFIEALFRCAAQGGRPPVVWATPSEALEAAGPEKLPQHAAGFSSWGRCGYADVWLQRQTDWMLPLLHAAEERLIAAADTAAARAHAAGAVARAKRVLAATAARKERVSAGVAARKERVLAAAAARKERVSAGVAARKERVSAGVAARKERVLAAAARELMLAQSSDWAFYLDAGTMPAYAVRRFQGHLDRMNRLLDAVEQGRMGGGDAEPPPYGRRLLPSLQAAWYRSGGTAPERERAAAPAGQRQQHRLRVLMLAWEYPPHIVGGLGKAVGDLAQELAAQGRDVHVITRAPDDAAALRAAVEFGVTVHRVPVPPSLEPVPFIDWVFRMNVAFAAYASHLFAHGAHFDVVHAHDWLVAAAAAELRAAAQLPLVATVHATEYGRRGGCLAGPVSPHLHAQEARLLAAADEVIVCSEAMRAELRRAHPDAPAQPRVIPCGHNAPAPDAAAGAASPLALPPRSADAPVLAFLGRLVPEKGVQVLLTALPYLLARYPALTLVIAGEGPQRPELEALAAPFGERVRFAGFLAGEAKAALLARADLTVMPSLYEPFGLVALEAMMAGTPLLASAVGGLADIVTHGADGELVPPGDADALAERTLAMLGDAAYRSKLAAAAQQTVRERYSMKLVAEQTVRVYETAIARQESQQGHV